MEEVLEPLLGVRRVGGPRSPTVGIERQLDRTPGFGRKGKSEKPKLVEENRSFGVKRMSVYKGERELIINTTLDG